MAKQNLNVRILQRRDTASNWTSQNPILMKGEIAIVDTAQGESRLKIGNGSSTFTELPFIDEPVRNSLQSKQNANVVYQTKGESDDDITVVFPDAKIVDNEEMTKVVRANG